MCVWAVFVSAAEVVTADVLEWALCGLALSIGCWLAILMTSHVNLLRFWWWWSVVAVVMTSSLVLVTVRLVLRALE